MVIDQQGFLDRVVATICDNWLVDAIYLYGSRARGDFHEKSDWDFAVLFSDYIKDPVDRALRPQMVQQLLEETYQMYDLISVVDLEIVPAPLQVNVIKGLCLFAKVNSKRYRVEQSIYSKIEKDYDNDAG